MRHILLAGLLSLIFLLTNFFLLLNNESFHSDKVDDERAFQIVSFIRSETDTLPEMTPNESSHLEDVRVLIHGAKSVLYILILSVVSFIAYILLKGHKGLIHMFFLTSAYTGAFLVTFAFLMVALSLFFTQSFELFHVIFFPQGNYTFPADSTLIQIFPQQYFFDFFVSVVFSTFLQGAVIIFLLLMSKVISFKKA